MIEFLIAAIICVVLDLFLLVRVLNGPTAVDRLCGIDSISLVTALGLAAYTMYTGRIIYLDVALVDAALGFSVRFSYPAIWREDYEYDFASDY